jgi:poly(3-hydroxyalkanoate) synthetase
MIPMPTAGTAELMRAAATFNTKIAAGITKLSSIRDEQVQIATIPKDEVFPSDKVALYRHRPLAKRKIVTPVLIVYNLIGRCTMTDLQEDRSLIRHPLKHGLDVWVVDDEAKLLNYLRMEKWLADRPHHAGEVAKQGLKDFYQDNKLIKSELELGGRKVDLRQVTMPVLNIHAQDDHIIPPPTLRALEGKTGTKDYTELGLPDGHVGVFVSGKSQGIVGKGIVDWLARRDS